LLDKIHNVSLTATGPEDPSSNSSNESVISQTIDLIMSKLCDTSDALPWL